MSRSRRRAISTSSASRSGNAGPILTRDIAISGDLTDADLGAVFACDLVDPAAVDLLRGERELEALAHHPGKKAADRMWLPSGGFHDGGDRGACRRSQHRDDARLLRARVGLVGLRLVSRPVGGLCRLSRQW